MFCLFFETLLFIWYLPICLFLFTLVGLWRRKLRHKFYINTNYTLVGGPYQHLQIPQYTSGEKNAQTSKYHTILHKVFCGIRSLSSNPHKKYSHFITCNLNGTKINKLIKSWLLKPESQPPVRAPTGSLRAKKIKIWAHKGARRWLRRI